ncbi:MAG: isoaspartyl peptidase/L-asparaginase [Acidilobaceae archaeon]
MAVIAVHGGAGSWRGRDEARVVEALRSAVEAGLRVSENGCLDMVVEAVAYLEDSGLFNAGTGSILDYSGGVSMDAGLMTSSGRAAGVAAVRYPRNPIRLARVVLEETPHVLLVGHWADELAVKKGLPPHPGPSPQALERWRLLRETQPHPWLRAYAEAARKLGYDTVGAVALDDRGCLAAAASTGGVSLKLPGRVGDSPIPGAGFHASDLIASSATGIGETIILSMVAFRASYLYSVHGDLVKVLHDLVSEHTLKWGPDTLGVISLTRSGEVGGCYNTEAMPWAWGSSSGRIEVLGLPRHEEKCVVRRVTLKL